jgi:predicted oxidoreductase
MKSMHLSVAKSLEKLQTSYIDVLYLHWWDFTTSVEEVMIGLNALITSGKVLYLGVSDTPAWIVVKANEYARAHGLRPFSVYQGKWNAGFRDIEREILPMCRDQGMAITPWAPLGEGKFKAAAQRSGADGSIRATMAEEHDIKVSEALERIADRKSTTLHSVVRNTWPPEYQSILSQTNHSRYPGYCISSAQGALRLPHRRTEGPEAPARQCQSAWSVIVCARDSRNRQRGPVRCRIPSKLPVWTGAPHGYDCLRCLLDAGCCSC